MTMHEAKVGAEFQFVNKLANTKLSARIQGVVHLFEHAYDGLHFWHGVAEVAVPLAVFQQHPPADSWVVRANVFLEDGRAGQCQVLRYSAERGPSDDYARIQLIGVSKLAAFDPDDPHFTTAF